MSKELHNWNFFEIVNLFIQNRNNFLYGREIAKKLKKPQKTIQNLLNELENENILIKKVSGRNLNFILNLNSIDLKETLLLTEVLKVKKLKKNFEIAQIINEIENYFNCPVLIFGSYAKNYYNEESDLDILILGKENKNFKKIQSKYIIKINPIYLLKKEFEKGLNKDNDFEKEVLRNHILVKKQEYFIKLWRKYYGR